MIPDRTKRIKDAKSEAHKEIEEYRQQKEEEFKKFEGEVRIRLLHCCLTGKLALYTIPVYYTRTKELTDYSRQQHSSGYKKVEEDASKEADAKLAEIKEAGNKQGDKVVDGLIHALVDVKPEPSEKIVTSA